MIGSLRGTLLQRSDDEVLVEVAGIGYRVVVSPTTAFGLGDLGDEVFLWVHHHIREDHQALYGFATAEARLCFTGLLGAHGVGPALALAILSVHGPQDLARVLADDDVAALCLVPGVGKKTATRLLVELKSRLDIPLDIGSVGGRADAASPAGASGSSARADVREALAGLGYTLDDIRGVLADLPDSDDPSALLRDALQRLAGARSGGG